MIRLLPVFVLWSPFVVLIDCLIVALMRLSFVCAIKDFTYLLTYYFLSFLDLAKCSERSDFRTIFVALRINAKSVLLCA